MRSITLKNFRPNFIIINDIEVYKHRDEYITMYKILGLPHYIVSWCMHL